MSKILTKKNAGSILKKLRLSKSVTREKLSRISSIDANMIYRFETGRSSISVSRFIGMMNDLGMDIIISPKE